MLNLNFKLGIIGILNFWKFKNSWSHFAWNFHFFKVQKVLIFQTLSNISTNVKKSFFIKFDFHSQNLLQSDKGWAVLLHQNWLINLSCENFFPLSFSYQTLSLYLCVCLPNDKKVKEKLKLILYFSSFMSGTNSRLARAKTKSNKLSGRVQLVAD